MKYTLRFMSGYLQGIFTHNGYRITTTPFLDSAVIFNSKEDCEGLKRNIESKLNIEGTVVEL